jgi:hypothetical protein
MTPENHDALFRNAHSFGFEQLPLKRSVGFADEQFAAGAHDAMPRHSLTAWASSHRAASSARPAGQSQGFGNLLVRGDTPTRYFFHKIVYGFPIHPICSFNAQLYWY